MSEKITEDIAVLIHRVTSLEKMPPRVQILEQEVAGVKREVHLAREEISEVKVEVHQTGKLALKIETKINQLFWTGAGVALTCSIIGAVAAVLINIINSGVFN